MLNKIYSQSNYEKEKELVLATDRFKSIAPIIVIDCSHQNETLKFGAIYYIRQNVPAKIISYYFTKKKNIYVKYIFF